MKFKKSLGKLTEFLKAKPRVQGNNVKSWGIQITQCSKN